MKKNVNEFVRGAAVHGGHSGVEIVYDSNDSSNNNTDDNNNNTAAKTDSVTFSFRRGDYNNDDDDNNNDEYNKKYDDENNDDALDRNLQRNRPLDTALMQQRVKAWSPILDPVWVILSLLLLSMILIPTGYKMKLLADEIIELKVTYDSYDSDEDNSCGITTVRQGRKCLLNFTAPRDMEPPILVHYEIENFHQNHRSYFQSLDPYQLYGQLNRYQDAYYADACQPLNKLGNISLNPCGLIANTFFNDVFLLQQVVTPAATSNDNNSTSQNSNDDDIQMIEQGIAWQSDIDYLYRQPDGFYYEPCPAIFRCSSACCHPSPPVSTSNNIDNLFSLDGNSQSNNNNNNNNNLLDHYEWSCETPYIDPNDGTCYRYYYPDDNTTQYLYETYPEVINPIEGILNEHFIVWMRVASLPTFRKLYGYIDQPIAAGTMLSFEVTANYLVRRFNGKKSLILSTNNVFGSKNYYMPMSFISIGIFSAVAGVFFSLKHTFRRRKIADPMYLQYDKDD